MANNEKLIFPIGFDLEEGVKQVQKDWKSTYRKQLQDTVDKTPLKIKLDLDNKVLKSLSKMSSSVKSETKKTKDAIGGLKSQLKALSDEWNKLSASQRAGVEGSRLREQYRGLSREAAGYSSTLRSAVSSEDRLANAKTKTTKVTRTQNTAYATQSSYLSRLITRMAAYMSIHQVLSWVKQLREVTAEFELQRVSLGALIQDAYKANTIFERIKIQAVRSPYEVKDLVNYTKRLAAYGVEADDLMGTMNRLADISAGLGADMDRIILAYGQIQAAGVLKGTELRQLTELGIPMVELLAQYYTTLRNETISTAEVFDMISKKEVPFEAVKDILTDLTDEGGRFFDMQSKQAETLAGQWSNMKDTLSIMFDEIGRTEEVQEALHGWIDLVKWLALNWEEVGKQILFVGKTVGTIWALSSAVKAYNAIMAMSMATHLRYRAIYLGGMKLYKGILSLQVLFRAETYKQMAATIKLNLLRLKELGLMGSLQLAMKKTLFGLKAIGIQIMKLTARIVAFMLTNPVGWAFAIAGAIAAITLNSKRLSGEGVDSMEKFNESLKEVTKEAIRNTEKLVANFGRLAREAASATNGSKKQQEALRRLQQQYGEIFTAEELEIENLRRITEGTDDARAAFDRYADSIRSFEQARFEQEVIEQYYTKLEEKFKDVFSLLTDEHGKNYASLIGYIQRYAPTWGEKSAEDILKEVIKKYMEDTGITSLRLRPEKWLKTVREYDLDALNKMTMGELMKLLELTQSTTEEALLREESGVNKYAAAEILMLYELAHGYAYLNEDVTAAINSFNDLDPAMSAAIDRSQELAHEIDNVEIKPLLDEETGEQISRTAEQIKEAYDEELADLVKQKRLDLVADVKLNLGDGTITEEDKARALSYFDEEANQLMGIWEDQWKKDMSSMVTFLDEGTRKVQVYSTDQIKGFTNLNDALDDAAKRHKELSESQEQLQKTANALDLAPVKDEKLIETYRQEITKNEEQLRLLYEFLEKYGALDRLKEKDKSSPKTDPRIKQLEEELSMVEKIYKKYQDYRKMMGAEEARAMTEKYFEGVDFQWLDMAFSPEELKAQSEEALRIVKTFWGDTKKAQQNIQFKIGDVDYNETKRELEQKMKKLSDDISRTKTAKEFFEKVLGMTGDKELSASLTVSIYGGVSSDDLGETLAKDMAKKLEEQVQEYFGDIDISSAINKATGEIDPIKLETLLTDENIKAIGEDNVKEIRKVIADLQSANSKYWSELMKDLEQTKTYGEELVKIYETTQERLAKIDAREDLDADTKKQLKDRVKEWQDKEMQKLQYEAFKDSPMYVAMFEKLDTTSTTMLTNMRSHLVRLKSEWKNLDPTQLKELQSRINEIDKQLSARNPFKSIVDGIKEFDALQKSGSRKDAEEALSYAATRRFHAERRYKQAIDEGKSDEEIKRLASFLERCVEAEDEAAKKMSEWDDATQKVVQGINGLQQVVNLVQTTTSAVNDIVNAFGGWGDAADEEFWNTMIEGINGLISGAQSAGTGIAQIISGDIIGGATSLISGIGSVVSSITNLAYAGTIKRANQEIERQQELLDNLSYSYDRLQKSAERAFGTEYIQNYQRQLTNLEAQVEAYEKQLEAERSKGKKSDEEKIKEYQEQIRDTKDAIEDMYGSLSEHFLGTDLTSAARDFASAWIEAYKSFSNTTDAMKEKFQEMIQNMIVESLIAKVMERALKPVFDMVDNMGDSDFYSTSFWSQLMTEMNTATENGVVGAERIMQMFEQMGINLRDTGTGLTGISRDIASASEESILGLAAGINTQNFYISQVPTKLDTIIDLLRGGSAVVDSGVNVQDLITIQNQFLSHLPTIAQNTAETVARCERAAVACESMASKLGSVIKPKGTTSTHSVNVTIGS